MIRGVSRDGRRRASERDERGERATAGRRIDESEMCDDDNVTECNKGE